jgi:hypothetical protein
VTERRASNERVPATAGHSRLFVLRMNSSFHGFPTHTGPAKGLSKGRAV